MIGNKKLSPRFIISVLATILVSAAFYQKKGVNMEETVQKKVNVWDTYVTKKDGGIMHFDIIAPVKIKDTSTIYNYGKAYLKTKGQEGQGLTAKQCRLCHIERLRPAWEQEIEEKGYFIIEMEGCN
ncbi:MAG: DUF2024 family protein [Bacteroidota bacterium]